jgi:hypothetical protein
VSDTQRDDEVAVRQLLERFVDATYRGDVSVLRSSFHEKASMNGYLGSELLLGTPEPFYADIESHPSMADSGAPFEAQIEIVQVSDRTASVLVRETGFFGDGKFIDHFHLLKTDGEWRIITKTFETL